MNLFSELKACTQNILPCDGIVTYQSNLFSSSSSQEYFDYLLNHIPWQNDEVWMFGKRIITKRKVAWYGNKNISYSYSGKTLNALLWTSKLLELKSIVEQLSNDNFNACLLNLYHNGREAMSWHSDDEPELKPNGTIASLSFGKERKFSFKHKTKQETISLLLENGSLLLMKGTTQQYWLHQLPVSAKVLEPRINLTFRTIIS